MITGLPKDSLTQWFPLRHFESMPHLLKAYWPKQSKVTQCSGRELLYLVREIEMDETNLCTIPLSILVSWQTNSD